MNRSCRKCGGEFPATGEFFYRAGNYLNFICKPCMAAHVRAWKDERHQRRIVTFPCKWCGASVTRTVGANGKSDYCSRSCKDKARRAVQRAEVLAAKPADRRCTWCGDVFPQSMRADAFYCSVRCNDAAHSRMRNWRRRVGGKATARPRLDPLPTFIDIAERDGWMCGICGKPVNRRRKHPDPLCGSLDHLVPISRGGADTPDNLQLAHLRCNCQKGNRAVNDQLRLIG